MGGTANTRREKEREELLYGKEDLSTEASLLSQRIPLSRSGSMRSSVRREGGDDAVQAYIENCREYQVPVDPSIVITLKTEWEVLKPTKTFCEGSMLPLMGVLDTNVHIKKLNLKGAGMHNRKPDAGNGNSNARSLRHILKRNKVVDTLDVSNTGLDNDGLHELCEVIKDNSTITELNLSRNHFSATGCEELSHALTTNEGLRYLDVSRNALGFRSIQQLQEVLNSMTHGIGFIFSVIGTILLMTKASQHDKTPYHFWGCLIFSASLQLLFLFSTLFHSCFMIPFLSWCLRIADHCAIYLLIAGSYTPFMMITLHHAPSGQIVLVMQWIAAICGCLFSISNDLSEIKTTVVELMLYLSMGLAILGVWEDAVTWMDHDCLVLVCLGGAAYVLGVVFFIWGEHTPIYHCVWHVFVMIASLFHWCAVFFYVVDIPLTNECPVGS